MLCMYHQGFSQSSGFYVLDPQNRWMTGSANIDEAELTVKPKGVYMEYGLYLTISAKGSSYYGDANPPLEIVMNFCLPDKAIIHDSWLWVNNNIMQAILIDKQIAYQIYEGIVNRRRDPSVLYKNQDGCYELRIYPLSGNSTRKVKITYLVPTRWTRNLVSAPLPLDLMQLSYTVPDLVLNIHTDHTFQNPSVNELGFLPFANYAGGGVYTSIISSSLFNDYTSMELSFSSPLQSGLFSAEYPSGAGSGYYQLVFHQQQALGLDAPKKVAIAIEYTQDNSEVQRNELLVKTKQMLLEYFSPTDSFNLFFVSNTVRQVSQQWMPATPGMINSAFASVPVNWQASANTQLLLSTALSFIRSKGTGKMLLISNNHSYMSNASANQMANQLVAIAKPDIPINVVDYSDYYYGYSQDYLYQQLAGFTGGNYVKHEFKYQYDYWDYYYDYNTVTTFSDLMHTMFSSFEMVAENSSLQVEPDVGFCYSEIELSEQNHSSGQPVMVVGKYYGSGPLKVKYNGFHNSGLVSQSWQSISVQGDSITRKIWAGNFIYNLENEQQLNTTKREIIDSSMANRVLSLYTAFLALEPNDTISACENCEDDSDNNNGSPQTSVTNPDSMIASIAASPNPFAESVTITINLTEGMSDAKVSIYNMMGQELKVFKMEATSNRVITITWNGDDADGNKLPEGVYIVVLKTPLGKQVLKLVKTN